MSYSTRDEVREMIKDDALNALIGDNFIENIDEREAFMAPLIDAAIGDADAEIDGYLAKRYAGGVLRPQRSSINFQRTSQSTICSPASASTKALSKRPT